MTLHVILFLGVFHRRILRQVFLDFELLNHKALLDQLSVHVSEVVVFLDDVLLYLHQTVQ